MNVLKDTPNVRMKSEYFAFVQERVNKDEIIRTGDVSIALKPLSVNARKLYVYAFSLPFWATMPQVCDEPAFYDLLKFVNAQDMIIAPDSMFNAFCVSRCVVENIL